MKVESLIRSRVENVMSRPAETRIEKGPMLTNQNELKNKGVDQWVNPFIYWLLSADSKHGPDG
jgi:hypothetical protein